MNHNSNHNNSSSSSTNNNLGNSHISDVLSIQCNGNQLRSTANNTDASPEWYNLLLGFVKDEIRIVNKSDRELNFHIFGSAQGFPALEGQQPEFYKCNRSVDSNDELEFRPFGTNVEITVTYTNQDNQIVKLIKRNSKAGNTFTVFPRHLDPSQNNQISTISTSEFDEHLTSTYHNYHTIPNNNNIQ